VSRLLLAQEPRDFQVRLIMSVGRRETTTTEQLL
jgi:hypothetical protein